MLAQGIRVSPAPFGMQIFAIDFSLTVSSRDVKPRSINSTRKIGKYHSVYLKRVKEIKTNTDSFLSKFHACDLEIKLTCSNLFKSLREGLPPFPFEILKYTKLKNYLDHIYPLLYAWHR